MSFKYQKILVWRPNIDQISAMENQTIDKMAIPLLLTSVLGSRQKRPHRMRFAAVTKATKTTATPKGVTKR